MVRSFSLLLVLAATGLVWGQSSSTKSPYTVAPNEQILTVHETGRPGQKCRVVKTWLTVDGSKAYQVQALESGETLTIVENGQTKTVGVDSRMKATSTMIYHWTADGKPPRGAPVPPDYAPPAVASVPTPTVKPALPVPSPGPVAQKPAVIPPAPLTAVPPPSKPVPSDIGQASAVVPTRPVVQPNPPTSPLQSVPLPVQAPTPKVVTSVPAPSKPTPSGIVQASTAVKAPAVVQPNPPTSPFRAVPLPTQASTPGGIAQTSAAVKAPPVVQTNPSTSPFRVVPIPAQTSTPKVVTSAPVVNPPCDPCQPCQPCQPPVFSLPYPTRDTHCQTCPPNVQPSNADCPVCQTTPPIPPMPVVTNQPAPGTPRQPFMSKLLHMGKKNPPTPVVVNAVPAPMAHPYPEIIKPVAAERPSLAPAKPAMEVAQPTDWRQSWGNTKAPAGVSDNGIKVSAPSPYSAPHPTPLEEGKKPDFSSRPTLPTAENKGHDPLQNPEGYLRRPLPERLVEKKDDLKPVGPTVVTSVMPKDNGPPLPFENAAIQNAHATVPATTTQVQSEVLPAPAPYPGSASVTAATSVQYVPVPVGTNPDPGNLPRPPEPAMPRPPQPTKPFPMPPAQTMPTYGPTNDVNAFTPAAPPLPASVTSNGFGPVAPAMQPEMLPTQDPVAPPSPQTLPEPQPSAISAPIQQSGYSLPPALQQATLPPERIPAPVVPAVSVLPPPNQSSPLLQTVATLKNALLPSEREMAAWDLGRYDARSCPEGVEALLGGAQHDPAPAVRGACVRALVKMNASTMPVVKALEALRSDRDPGVQHEVEQAINVLSASFINAASQGIQPAAVTVPEKPQ